MAKVKVIGSVLYVSAALAVVPLESTQANSRTAPVGDQTRLSAYQDGVVVRPALGAYPSPYQGVWVQPRVFTRAEIEGIRVLERMR
jgi:hypothetical protein